MKLRPLGDHVVIRPIESEDMTSGGIVLPDTAKEQQTKGKVIAVGTGRVLSNGKRVVPGVKNGDTVIYGKYAGSDVKIQDEELKICSESEILAIVK